MRRRDFITLLGGAAVAWPLAARAQQAAMPVIGYLSPGLPDTIYVAAFRKGLAEAGFVEGRNVAIEFRLVPAGQEDRLPEMAAELVRRRVTVLAAPGSMLAALAAKGATSTLPIVFSTGGDPVQAGLVSSYNRPGGNVTGINYLSLELGGKRLGILRELVPTATRFALLVSPNITNGPSFIAEVQTAAAAVGGQLEVYYTRTATDIDTAFAALVQTRTDALMVAPGAPFGERRSQVLTLTARHAMPAMYSNRDFVDVGGLISYGSSVTDQFRQPGIYTGRVLKGEKPADMPILQAVRFELVINLQTAKVLGIQVPATLLAQSDAVIE
jgi:putative ABC transport system substrate-binding protein